MVTIVLQCNGLPDFRYRFPATHAEAGLQHAIASWYKAGKPLLTQAYIEA